ncbi:MAG: hypothetical protein ACRCZW_09960 [Lactobacillaceae bacterium]
MEKLVVQIPYENSINEEVKPKGIKNKMPSVIKVKKNMVMNT